MTIACSDTRNYASDSLFDNYLVHVTVPYTFNLAHVGMSFRTISQDLHGMFARISAQRLLYLVEHN